MSNEDDNLLRFLSAEKFDLEDCSEKTSGSVKKQLTESAGSILWTSVASLLFVLSLVSGALQFCQGGLLRNPFGVYPVFRPVLQPLHRPVILRPVISEVPSTVAGVDVVRDVVENERSVALLGDRVFVRCGDVDSPRLQIYSREIVPFSTGRSSVASNLAVDVKGIDSKAPSVGRFLVSRPFRMKYDRLKSTEAVASFQTSFVFSIENTMRDLHAANEGLAFVMLSRGNVAFGSSMGKLGVVETSRDHLKRTFAVQFGSRGSSSVHGSRASHVRIRTGSAASVAATNAGFHSQAGEFQSLDLTRGRIQAWVEFDGMTKEIKVSVSPILGTKPSKPLLSRKVDLSKLLEKFVSVGFSAAPGFSTKRTIHSWRFEKSVKLYSGPSKLSFPYDTVPFRSTPWQDSSSPREHLSRLPLFRYPGVNRNNGGGLRAYNPRLSSSSVRPGALAITSSSTLKSSPGKMNSKNKPCHNHVSAGFNFAAIKEHVLRSVWVLLAVVSGLLFFHFLFITYRMCVRCFDFFQENDDAEGSDYVRIMDPKEHLNQDVRYVLVVSPEHQSEERSLATV